MTHTEARELASQFGTRMCDENGDTHGEELYCFDLDDIIAIKEALAQRTWVGLTNEEIDDIYWQHESKLEHQVFIWPYERTIEAKLKEKNT